MLTPKQLKLFKFLKEYKQMNEVMPTFNDMKKYMQVKSPSSVHQMLGYLEEIKRMEVHEHSTPIVGHKGHSAHRLVLKTQNKKKLIIPPKLKDVY